MAGAANAGGFIAVGKYTSHMTGITSSIADSLSPMGDWRPASLGLAMLLAFICGAAFTAFLVNWARRSAHRNPYVLPLLLESVLLLVFGLFEGAGGREGLAGIAFAEILLAFMMGLQNALITKVAHAEIRTTHVTGMVTDLGIELGKLFYWNRDRSSSQPRVSGQAPKDSGLAVSFFGCFFLGGLAGALGFKSFGYYAVLPLAFLPFCHCLAPSQAGQPKG